MYDVFFFFLKLSLLTLGRKKKTFEKLWLKNEVDHLLGAEVEKDCHFSLAKKNARMRDSVEELVFKYTQKSLLS